MPLQLGNWDINSNGMEGTLFIGSVNTAGRVEGSLLLTGSTPVGGFWNEVTHELIFAPLAPGDARFTLPVFYWGYLFSTPINLQPGQDFNWNLSGYFQMADTVELQSSTYVVNLPTPNSRRSTFGWFAQHTTIV